MRAGIWSPGLDLDGDTAHETGTGRLSWLIARDGGTVLYVNRPGAKLYRLGATVVPSERRGFDAVQAVLDEALPQIVRLTPVYGEEALDRLRNAAQRIRMEGLEVDLPAEAESSPAFPEGVAGVRLYLQQDGAESVSVLRAAVTGHGDVVVQRQIGPGLYYRHVEALVRAIGVLGIQWEPGLELA